MSQKKEHKKENQEISVEEEVIEKEETLEDAPSAEQEDELASVKDQLLRTIAEFDNYRKRTAKEKEALYESAVSHTVEDMLPVMDNLARALNVPEGSDVATVIQGVEMIIKQIEEVFEKLGVQPIKAVGEPFDPQIHDAVMHVEDDTVGESIVVEEFVKGYMLKDKVLRHSVVKVAN